MWRRPVSLINARVVTDDGLASSSSLRFSARVLSVGAPPRRGDVVVDVDGALVFPGLINAHDHLELNHFGRLKFREAYRNAADWIEDMRPRLRSDPTIVQGRAHSLADRLLIGGLKNLLAGVTTVAHHNPFYRELRARFPVRVVRRYGWAHSFFLQGQPVGARGERGGDVRRAYRSTPPDAPFLIHLAEGVDEPARLELGRLDELGCLGGNSVLIHGVGIRADDWPRVLGRGAGLVWCPGSNLFLLGRSARVREFLDFGPARAAPICLGTDSRLSGSRDLLEEMRVALATAPVTPDEVLRMVSVAAGRLLRLADAGRIARGVPADLVVVPRLADDPARALLAAVRSQILLVTVGGRPLVGSPQFAPVFAARRIATRPATLDGAPTVLHAAIARRVQHCSLAEPGLEID